MEQNEHDLEYLRGLLTRKVDAGEDVVLESDRAAVLQNTNCPRAELHFIVLPKLEIENVTALKLEHLPLLDHMLELANQIIDKQHLPSSNFRIGFKMNAFMNRLNMHVISDDFCSENMRRIHHWNTFNTDLFITFQAVYALLRFKGCIEPLSTDIVDKLRSTTPVQCNQCTFKTSNFEKFKSHLYYHWDKKKRCIGVSNLTQTMGNMHLNPKQNICGVDHGSYVHGPNLNYQRFPPAASNNFNRAPNGQKPHLRTRVNNNQLNDKHPVHNPFRPAANGTQQTNSRVDDCPSLVKPKPKPVSKNKKMSQWPKPHASCDTKKAAGDN